MSQIKMRVAIADLLLPVSTGIAMAAHYVRSPLWSLLLKIQFAFVFGAFAFYLNRLKCPHCGRRLMHDFPGGALALLPFAKQPCKQCGKII